MTAAAPARVTTTPRDIFEIERLRHIGATVGPALSIIVVQQIVFPTPVGVTVQGLTIGLLGALVALGMALIYRANRILNFAQGDIGLIPTSFAVNLILFSSLNYYLAFALGLAGALVVGGVIELAIIRRFFRAPRLILTVATIGLAQLLAFVTLLIPQLWGEDAVTSSIAIPIDWKLTVEPIIFKADYLVAWILAPLVLLGIALFLRFTDVGIAIRAAAERSDRASLLGIPVGRLHTYVWGVACALSFIALFLRAGISGLPFGQSLGFTVLLSALAALMLGKLTNLPAIALSAVALGLLEQAVQWNDTFKLGPITFDIGSDLVVAPVLGVVILVSLLVQRKGTTRAETDTSSSWQAAEEVRPIPAELRHLTEVRAVKLVGFAIFGVFLLGLPHILGPGDVLKAGAVLIFAIIILSIVILTGWAGQVSLGQMGFVAVGAAVAAKATSQWDLDLTLALVLAGLVGALFAVLVGLPALRLSGLYLAVTTLAFALATTSYFLNQQFFSWIPLERIERPPLLGQFSYDSPVGIYYVALGSFVLVTVGVLGIRRSRTGRVLVALRENEKGVQAFGVSIVRAKLTAFALSGFLAAFAGGLLVHHQQQFSLGLFPAEENLVVFTAAVVGGLGSATGAALGALFMKGGQWFLPGNWRLFASAIGVLVVLLVLPGGLGGLWFRVRDLWLRWVAERRGIVVPSLLADVRQVEEEAGAAFEARAEAMAAGGAVNDETAERIDDPVPAGSDPPASEGDAAPGATPRKKVVKKVKKKAPAAAAPGGDP